MTDTVNASGKRRLLANFDCYNKDILLQILERHLQRGYMLSSVKGFIGLLTFEPVPAGAKVTYAVIRPALYTSDRIPYEDWKKCGSIGDYAVYRNIGGGGDIPFPKFPEPDKDPAEVERSSRNTNIFCSVLWFLQLIMRLSMLDSEPFITVCVMINAAGYMYKALKTINRHNTQRGLLVYFWRYFLSYAALILLIFILFKIF